MFKRSKSVSMLLLLGGLSAGTAHAIPMVSETAIVQQNDVCKGFVRDAAGEPIIGASVVVKGTTNGTITDLEGNFELTNVNQGDVIQISFIGYKTQEFKWSGQALKVSLKEDTKALEEVVVVGYGVQKKANLSGSVAQVDKEQLQNRPIQNVSSGLQGLMPGVTVTGTNGAPGQDSGSIRVRGTGTLNSASPYILIDGVESATMSAVDPSDIESISVLKDAASAAIYGSKAANGVILITTKRGSSGKPKISYSGYVSFQNATNLIDRMDSYEYASMYNDLLKKDGQAPRFTDEEIQKFKDGNDPNYPNTDWYDLAYKTGIQHRHNVNISGGTEHVKYMGSLGYLNQTGVLPNAEREQFNARTNLDMKITDRLTAKLNLSYIKNDYADASSAYAGGSSDQVIRQLNVIAPWIVNQYEDGTYGTISDGNPIAWLDHELQVRRDNHNFTGMASLSYKITDFLTATATGSYVSNFQDYNYFQKHIQYNPNKESEPNELKWQNNRWDRTNYDALLNYDQTFGKHNIKGLLGWHTEKYNMKNLYAYRQNFPNNELTDMNAGAANSQKNEGYTRELAMVSWFARVNYDFAGKYLLEANIRSDASSRFAEGHRWGYFPSFSGAWRISEEAFMENTKEWMSMLKIRASWGQLGNQDALSDYYPALNTYNIGATYPFGGTLNSGYFQSDYRLSTISWEKSTTWGIGVDFGFLNNKITGSLDYYNRETKDILMGVTVPNEFGLNPYTDNVGSMRNSGFELNIAYNDKWGDWTFGAAANLSYNKSEMLDLGGAEYLTAGYEQRHYLGEAFNNYYVYKTDGFFQSDEEAAAYQKKYGRPFGADFKAGDLKYVDINGDGQLTGDDRYLAGSSEPKYTFGLNLNASWKNIDLSMMFNGAADVYRLFDAYEVYGAFSGDAGHPSKIWRKAWTPENRDAEMPRAFIDTNSPSCPRKAVSDFWLQNTSYLRMKNLQVGYTIPKSVLSHIGLENVRFYYSVENLFTIDGMKDKIDPEATSQRLSSYPLLRTHAFGVNVSF